MHLLTLKFRYVITESCEDTSNGWSAVSWKASRVQTTVMNISVVMWLVGDVDWGRAAKFWIYLFFFPSFVIKNIEGCQYNCSFFSRIRYYLPGSDDWDQLAYIWCVTENLLKQISIYLIWWSFALPRFCFWNSTLYNFDFMVPILFDTTIE